MRPVPLLSDYMGKIIIPASRTILKPEIICRFVSLVLKLHPVLNNILGAGDFEIKYQTSKSCTKRRNPEVKKLRFGRQFSK